MYGVVTVSMTEQEQAEVDPSLAEFDFIFRPMFNENGNARC